MDDKYIMKFAPILLIGLYVLLILIFGIMMNYDAEWCRKISMLILVIGTLSSFFSSTILTIYFFSGWKSGKELNVNKETNFYLFILAMFISFTYGNIILGAISRFNGPEISLPYIAALNGVGLPGIFLIVYFFLIIKRSATQNKKDNRLNVSLLPLLIALLSSNIVMLLTFLIVIIIIVMLIIVAVWTLSGTN